MMVEKERADQLEQSLNETKFLCAEIGWRVKRLQRKCLRGLLFSAGATEPDGCGRRWLINKAGCPHV